MGLPVVSSQLILPGPWENRIPVIYRLSELLMGWNTGLLESLRRSCYRLRSYANAVIHDRNHRKLAIG
jgi:hypothetical protein